MRTGAFHDRVSPVTSAVDSSFDVAIWLVARARAERTDVSPLRLQRLLFLAQQPVENGATDRVSLHGEAYRGGGGFAIVRDDEDDLSDQDGASGCNKHEQGAISARHGLFGGAGADELAHQQ